MIVSSSNLCTFCRRKSHHNSNNSPSASTSSPADRSSFPQSSSPPIAAAFSSFSKMTVLRWHLVIASFIFSLADAQSQLPPGPSLVATSPFVLDVSRGPLSIDCQVDYPEGDTDFSVDMSIEKIVWDANSKVYINKTICADTKSAVSTIKCEETFLSEEDMSAVKGLTVTFPESNSPYTYFAGNYICKRRARRKGVKAQTEFVKFQIIDCLTNSITELSVDGQRSDQSVDPIPVHLTKEEQTKQLTVVCSGRTLNPGETANVKLSYQLDESTEPRTPQGSSIVEAISVVPADSNYAILAEEKNVTVTTTLTFGLGDVGMWVVDCAMEQQPRCESQKTNKQIKIDVRIPKPIIECPKKVTPEVVPLAERKAVTSAVPGQVTPVPLRATIRCNITDGKPQDPETQPKIEWTWDDAEAAPASGDAAAKAVDPAITNEVIVVSTPARGYAAILKIDNVLDKHYRQYRVKITSQPTLEGSEADLLGEEAIELTAGNYDISPTSTAVRLGACLLLVLAAMFFQLAPSS